MRSCKPWGHPAACDASTTSTSAARFENGSEENEYPIQTTLQLQIVLPACCRLHVAITRHGNASSAMLLCCMTAALCSQFSSMAPRLHVAGPQLQRRQNAVHVQSIHDDTMAGVEYWLGLQRVLVVCKNDNSQRKGVSKHKPICQHV